MLVAVCRLGRAAIPSRDKANYKNYAEDYQKRPIDILVYTIKYPPEYPKHCCDWFNDIDHKKGTEANYETQKEA